MDSDLPNSKMAGIKGNGPGEKIYLDGIVTGSGVLEYAEITGLARIGTSPGALTLGLGTAIGDTEQEIWGVKLNLSGFTWVLGVVFAF